MGHKASCTATPNRPTPAERTEPMPHGSSAHHATAKPDPSAQHKGNVPSSNFDYTTSPNVQPSQPPFSRAQAHSDPCRASGHCTAAVLKRHSHPPGVPALEARSARRAQPPAWLQPRLSHRVSLKLRSRIIIDGQCWHRPLLFYWGSGSASSISHMSWSARR